MMEWTNEPPTKDGFYLYKEANSGVTIVKFDGDFNFFGDDMIFSVEEIKRWEPDDVWAGPLDLEALIGE